MILYSKKASNIIDRIYTDKSIFNSHGTFENWFKDWNYIFHQYVREEVLNMMKSSHGTFLIGNIGSLIYTRYNASGEICYVIEDLNFPFFRFTTTVPKVDTSKSPQYTFKPPTKLPFILPSRLSISKEVYYNGLKIGFYNGKYFILTSDNQPFVENWFNSKPKIFNKPFGKYNIIAHVNYHNSLLALSIDGQLYDMNKLWKDAYLSECINFIISKALYEIQRQNLNESKDGVIRLNESQLYSIIKEIVQYLVA